MKKIIKDLNKVQIISYIILMIIDIYILGSIDFVEHKIYGVLFVVINTCLITLIKYSVKDKK